MCFTHVGRLNAASGFDVRQIKSANTVATNQRRPAARIEVLPGEKKGKMEGVGAASDIA